MLELNGRFPQERPTGKYLNPKRCLIAASSRQRKTPPLNHSKLGLGRKWKRGKKMFGCFSSFLCVLSCWRLIARRYWRANNVQCGTLKINSVLEQSKLLAMKMRPSQCANTEQTWNQASLVLTLNIRVMRKRTEGSETTTMAQEEVNKVGRKWVGKNQKLLQSPSPSYQHGKGWTVTDQSTSVRVINKATYFCGKKQRTWFLGYNFPYGTSSLYNP